MTSSRRRGHQPAHVRGGVTVRVLGSLGLAIVVVLIMLMVGLHYYEPQEPERTRNFVDVTRATPLELERVREVLGQKRHALPEAPEPLPPPAARQVNGFVQLAFTVQTDGSISDVQVLGAVPEGVYERQAIEQLQSRSFPPRYDAQGRAMPAERTEIVHFSVDAATAAAPSTP